MSEDFLRYILFDVIFCTLDLSPECIKLELHDGVFTISYRSSFYKEDFFEVASPSLSAKEYEILDRIYNNISKKQYLTDFVGVDLPILKLIYFFSNEYYLIKDKYDKHGRIASTSVKTEFLKYLEKPIVDILISIFFKKLNFPYNNKVKLNLTCDYDILNFFTTNNWKWALKRHLKNILKLPLAGIIKEWNYHLLGKSRLQNNPFLNIEMFLLNEDFQKFEIENIAFMLVQQDHKEFDPYNDFQERSVRDFIKLLLANNIIIGIHPNYDTEVKKNLCQQNKQFEQIFGFKPKVSRNHYLRGKWPMLVGELQMNGINDDYTFGFPDSLLFRGGLSSAFKLWNQERNEAFDVLIHPLTIMDGTLQDYQNFNLEQARVACMNKFMLSYEFSKEITLLWHNRSMYKYGFDKNILPDVFDYMIQKVKKIDEYESL